ncbi:C-8 sterol isomerase erg2 [Neolecta irregularis DAH-3]|uniref:C-8 sterol isomerase n=1 Tax=Neolecta irregularis (strain DAH-3) TaxID=1198029 RepID=A0A1U7LNQ0_NEOID|nr:C-8 sterol isomerase erg2 [Neolecta irregularis DAH-3]|eukprot:OLL24151.1 C-8 sterol isomerase erg2 [Neolecta irregularis DAH-3]
MVTLRSGSALLAAVAVIFSCLDRFVLPRLFVFDPTKLSELSRAAVAAHGNDTHALLNTLVSSLKVEYGEAVQDIKDDEWIFNNAGNAMGALTILHASISEYLIIFGSAVGTEGHSGVHLATDYFNILVGEQWGYEPGQLKKSIYRPGDTNVLKRGYAIHYKMPDECWALELAQGWIPSMFPFGVIEILTSTFDFNTLYRTFWFSGKAMLKSFARFKF